jgi:predicted polyphosphate/ATP-dependent NAD kinase
LPHPLRLGLIVNPVAGLGGRVGLKGTDGLADAALALGAAPQAEARTLRALRRFASARSGIVLLAGTGAMGQQAAGAAGLIAEVVPGLAHAKTSAGDTIAIARAMQGRVDLILFAGGDGTARDLLSVVGDAAPILGIPAGVKMQSGVFAATPEAAGNMIAAIAAIEDRSRLHYRPSEVMDIDEDALRNGAISPRLFGYAKVPFLPLLLQNAKVRNHGLDEAALDAAARQIAATMTPETLYAIGPGRSAKRVLQALGISGAMLGTDLVLGGALVARDANERTILDAASGRALRIVVGVIGGQGYVFGRGNQELSPEAIRRAGRDGITILASQQKLLALEEKRLLVDTGDPALDRELAGYWRVVVGPQEDMVMRIETPGLAD